MNYIRWFHFTKHQPALGKQMVQAIFSNWGIDKNGNLMLLICIAFCVLIAWLLHLSIEIPFMKLRDRFIKQKITT